MSSFNGIEQKNTDFISESFNGSSIISSDLTKKEKSMKTAMGWIAGITAVILVVLTVIFLIAYFNKTFMFEPYVPQPLSEHLIIVNPSATDPLNPESQAKKDAMIKESQQRLANTDGQVNNPYYTTQPPPSI